MSLGSKTDFAILKTVSRNTKWCHYKNCVTKQKVMSQNTILIATKRIASLFTYFYIDRTRIIITKCHIEISPWYLE